jgi:pyrroline-5-carboxylate reductase
MAEALKLPGPLLLVGCGKMGGAMLDGWLERGLPRKEVFIVEPFEGQREALKAKGLQAVASAEDLPGGLAPAVVLLAIKPQQFGTAAPGYARFARPGCFFLSIVAGKTIAGMRRALGAQATIIRAMPNTPAAVGRGITVFCPDGKADARQRRLAGELLSAVGEVAEVEDESLIDAVTAVSGGGPAYVFLLIECLAKAGEASGLPPELAMRLARVTVSGAGELARRAAEPASKLRENVTSPGGTTLEALKVLMAGDGLQPLMTKAIAAATQRSRELAADD